MKALQVPYLGFKHQILINKMLPKIPHHSGNIDYTQLQMLLMLSGGLLLPVKSKIFSFLMTQRTDMIRLKMFKSC